MKTISIVRMLLLTLVLGVTGNLMYAQSHTGGIKKTAEEGKLITYEVRLESLSDETAGTRLEKGLLEKEGVLEAHADAPANRITLVVLPAITPELIGDIIDYNGYTVAKSFED